MDEEITEGEVVGEEILDKDVLNKERMDDLRAFKAKPLPNILTPKKRKQINVSKVMDKMGFCPARVLVLLAQNRWEELGLKGPVSAHEVSSAARTLFHSQVPGLRPVDFVSQEDVLKQIPVFIEKRGFAQQIEEDVPKDDDED